MLQYKKKIFRLVFTLSLFFALTSFQQMHSQYYQVLGPALVESNTVQQYTITTYTAVPIQYQSWMIIGGTEVYKDQISSTTYRVFVRWGSDPYGAVIFKYTNCYLNVSISGSALYTPSSPSIQSTNCGNTILSRGNPPRGITWYWQSSSSGTSTSNSSSTITKTSSGTQYLRARHNFSGTWSRSSSSKSYTVKQPSTWYADTDGDGFGDPAVTQLACSKPSGYVSNGNDNCPMFYARTNNGCGTNCNIEDINRIISKVYDVNGTLKGHSKTYYNTLGKSIQTQSLDIKTNKVWATNTLYDSHGRPAFQSLSAPVNETNCLLYTPNFIKNSSGNNYTISDFETNPESPSAVGTQVNTLGRYYSTSNKGEPYQDITSYPFSRTIYSKLNPGLVKKVIGGNKVTVNGSPQWAQGYSFSMPITQELHYAYGPNYFPAYKKILNKTPCTSFPSYTSAQYLYSLVQVQLDDTGCTSQNYLDAVYLKNQMLFDVNKMYRMVVNGVEGYYAVLRRVLGSSYNAKNFGEGFCGPYTTCADIQTEITYIKGTKTVNRDVHGVETVVFTDSDGNTLAAARSGNEDNPSQKKYNVISPIGAQGFVDIHIPLGCGGTVNFVGNSSAQYSVYDLITELRIVKNTSANSITLNPGMYRVEETTDYHKKSLPYITLDKGRPVLVDNANQVGVSYNVNYYDYSLNFYDKAGRLTQSVQPEGFDDTLNLTTSTRHHNLTSTFTYNSLGQLLDTTSPDEGVAEFLYRKDGQIRYSQNSKQAALRPKEISYTNYDDYGRPEESGVIATSTAFNRLNPEASALPSGTKKEQHFTIYDEPDTATMHAALLASGISTSYYPVQKFVAGNVSKTYTLNPITSTTWYSYDIYGRVEWLVEKIEGLGTKTINYTYDAITGAVTKVDYQKHRPTERFVHKYTYNIANQIIKVETSTNNTTYTVQAEYEYYETGALKRTEIAEDLQGIDYVYNINGQLKAINSPQGSGFKDPGNDNMANNGFKPDVFGMLIDYHDKDYSRTGTTYNGLKNTSTNNQLNGNIGSIRWHNSTNAPRSSNIDTYKYHYNKNNWLKQADYGVSNASSNVRYTQNSNKDYQVSITEYDANGNIIKLKRNKHYQSGSNAMDNLTYNYDANKKNQLKRIVDTAGDAANADDITTHKHTDNYVYNEIGQLIENKHENLHYYYNASGLVTEVKKNNVSLVKFFYNDRGHRVKKEIYTNGSLTRSDYYVRDASGSLMALYEGSTLKEHPIYGASRIGVHYRSSGINAYQLADHLGNVRAVVIKNGSSALSVTNKTDYYPGGMAMPNRNVVGDYRYGYQGEYAETDPETGKVAFELRLYDPRINRWLTTDPAGQFHSPYMSMGNNWVSRVDPDGAYSPPTDYVDENGNLLMHTEDGSNAVITVTNDKLEGFLASVRGTSIDALNSKDWNFTMKSYLVGREWTQTMENVQSWFATPQARGNVSRYWQTGDIDYWAKASNEHSASFRDPVSWGLAIAGGLTGYLGNFRKVGQWMTPEQYQGFKQTGIIPRGNVLTKGAGGFSDPKLTHYVEFRVHQSFLRTKDAARGWQSVIQNTGVRQRLATQRGVILPKARAFDINLISN